MTNNFYDDAERRPFAGKTPVRVPARDARDAGGAVTSSDDTGPALASDHQARTPRHRPRSRPTRVRPASTPRRRAPISTLPATTSSPDAASTTSPNQSELRDWIKDNATLLSNASLLISLAAVALGLLPSAGFLDPYIKALLFGAALLLLIELHHQWPPDLQLHALRRNIRPEHHSWRMTGFAFLMQVATLVFALWAVLTNPQILVPLTAFGIVLAFRQWYFRRFGGLLAKSFGIVALIAVLLISELLLLVIWEIVSERPLTYEVWIDEHAAPELPR